MAGRGYGTFETIRWNNRAARAWAPAPLARYEPRLGEATTRATERAAAAVRRAAEHLPPTWEPLARLLLRAEGVASSNIEGLRAPVALVAAAEIDDDLADTSDAAWIAGNLDAVVVALDAARRDELRVDELHRWHERLMRHSNLEAAMIGQFRSAQGWIGGASPHDAAYVPPAPARVAPLMNDLVAYANRVDVDPITQAAVVHAQFETIHPYGDGNGRIGRILVGWILVRRQQVIVPPPVSVSMARDVGGYLSGLYQFREGDRDAWIRWFAEVVRASADATVTLLERVDELTAQWRSALATLRADAAAWAVLEVLPAHPVVNVALVARELHISERTARSALDELQARQVLEPFDVPTSARGRPRRWWVAASLLQLVGVWSR